MIEKPSGLPPPPGGPGQKHPVAPPPLSEEKPATSIRQPFRGMTLSPQDMKKFMAGMERQLQHLIKWMMQKHKQEAQRMKRSIEGG